MPLAGVGEHVPKWLERREFSVSRCSLGVNIGWQSGVVMSRSTLWCDSQSLSATGQGEGRITKQCPSIPIIENALARSPLLPEARLVTS